MPQTSEFFFIKERFAEEGNTLKGKISGKPLYKLNENLSSSIVHSEVINLQSLKEQLKKL